MNIKLRKILDIVFDELPSHYQVYKGILYTRVDQNLDDLTQARIVKRVREL